MDIWIKRTSRVSKCSYCPEIISNGSFVVVGKLWRSKKGKLKWPMMFRWHTACWIEQGIRAVEEKERTQPRIETRGRKRSSLPEDQKKQRLKIMTRRASALQRIRAVVKSSGNIDKLIHLGGMLEKYKSEIEQLGGIPKGW